MKRTVWTLGPLLLAGFVSLPLAHAQEKPLPPGWLSLDSSVGELDKSIAEGKSSVEKALGLGISGYIDTGYNWSSNRPRRPANITGRVFDKNHNKLVFNDFHIAVEKPEKDWGVGFRIDRKSVV